MINSDTKIELLAPAKDKQIAKTAIDAGADAVYIGFLKFGARHAAGNSLEDIAEIVAYADIFRAKVYVTVNTVYTDKELPEVIKTINDLYNIGVSAIIIQDMGILNSELPPIPIFASTQCDNTSLEKILFFEKTGLQRVILPREMSLAEIKNISDNTNIELESFIHGALCVSYSGRCLLSYAIGGRSADRGECAQPCRKKYSLVDAENTVIAKDKYLLSLKDLNLSAYIKDLILSGITSFKIEGRLKDEAYVKNIVSFYRKKIDEVLRDLNLQKSSDGISYPCFKPDPAKTFNRGYTDFFIKGVRSKDICCMTYSKSSGEYIGIVSDSGKNSFIINGKPLNKGDGICFFSEGNELDGTKIVKTENNNIYPDSMKGIKKGLKISRNFDREFQKELSAAVERKIDINGNFTATDKRISLTLTDTCGNSVTETIEGSYSCAVNSEQMYDTVQKQLLKTGNTEFRMKSLILPQTISVFIPASMLNNLRRAATEKLHVVRIKNIKREIRSEKIIKTDYYCKNLTYSVNICNDSAKKFYEDRNSKVVELACEVTGTTKGKAVMLSKHCIRHVLGLCLKEKNDAKKYKNPLFLVDEKGRKFRTEFDCKRCEMAITD